MALSLDDRILGEKTQYYCSSSSEDEGDEEKTSAAAKSELGPSAQVESYSGHCVNTGPKGVVEDWRRYKQLETEKREEQTKEKALLAKRLAVTCRSERDDDTEAQSDAEFMQQLEQEFDNLDEEFLREYRQKRLEELRHTFDAMPRFGRVFELSKAEFVDCIDKESSNVFIIIHIYEKAVTACESLNRCFDSLAVDYPSVKFCRIRASEARLSVNFAVSGLPAILVYKKGELIGNFVRFVDEFGEDFFATDVESFLNEHGLLPAGCRVSSTSIRPPTVNSTNSDSDDDD